MKKLLSLYLILFSVAAWAQPFTFKSVGEAKEFRLTLYFGTGGKGAFVRYAGQKSIIPLQVKNYTRDTSGRDDGQPDTDHYVWDEIIDGKVNGTYRLSLMMHTFFDVSYTRKKDGRNFKLEAVDGKNEKYDGSDQYLLHGILISFNHFYNDRIVFEYGKGKKDSFNLLSIENPNSGRQSIIEDYNFDGYDDVAFSVPDAGMGVYRMFTVYLYDPEVKRFIRLKEPDYSRSSCTCLCDVTVDKKRKLLETGCRGGASWHKDTYRYDKNGTLRWNSSKADNE
ncbi:MAG: hypothetical protein LBE92_22040 [Chryseobacterium sp.]|jgi:hypothetical protein|uniref:XAC2610-related protein n=1 Tax=Chryseobacterium sp. TaxID=1871047 RepID=UPI0028367742|nr:hypothetical protein [Chryseobacterium sp.]MDR2238805.1 hypothetical protein [Chryseobacterium sp.]